MQLFRYRHISTHSSLEADCSTFVSLCTSHNETNKTYAAQHAALSTTSGKVVLRLAFSFQLFILRYFRPCFVISKQMCDTMIKSFGGGIFASMKLFLSTDFEGTSGIVAWEQIIEGNAEYEQGRL